MLINANEKGSTAYAIEPYFFVQKKTIVQEGERNDGPPPATIATSEGVSRSLGNCVTLHVLWGVMKSTRNSG